MAGSKNSNNTNGNRTGDLLTRSAVPQPTAPPRAPSPPSSTEVKERVYLGLYSPLRLHGRLYGKPDLTLQSFSIRVMCVETTGQFHTPDQFSPKDTKPQYPLDGLDVTQSRPGHTVRAKCPHPAGNEPMTRLSYNRLRG